MMRLKDRYSKEIVPQMMADFSYKNVMQVPRVEKVVVNVGLGEALQNARALDAAATDVQIITGQRPIVTRARKSIANFKLREGQPIGIKVTLRGARMYAFLERLFNIALARQRDVEQPLQKGVHARTTQSHLDANGLPFAQLEVGNGFASSCDNGPLACDDLNIRGCRIQRPRVLQGLAKAHVDHDLLDPWHLHHVLVREIRHHLRDNLFGVSIFQTHHSIRS